jgi:hypothetical protein
MRCRRRRSHSMLWADIARGDVRRENSERLASRSPTPTLLHSIVTSAVAYGHLACCRVADSTTGIGSARAAATAANTTTTMNGVPKNTSQTCRSALVLRRFHTVSVSRPDVSTVVSVSGACKWWGSKGLRKCFQCFHLCQRVFLYRYNN